MGLVGERENEIYFGYWGLAFDIQAGTFEILIE